MSTKTQTFCDMCGKEIRGGGWDHDPAQISIAITHPSPGSWVFHDCCFDCVRRFISKIKECVTKDQPTEGGVL